MKYFNEVNQVFLYPDVYALVLGQLSVNVIALANTMAY